MFAWFERRLDAFPVAAPTPPPTGLWRFVWHYVQPAWPLLLAVALFSTAMSVLEVLLIGFLGQLVDLLRTTDPDGFFQAHGTRLAWMASVAIVWLPLATLANGLTMYQGLMASLPMRIRWLGHRWLLGQSLGFFQDDFAGRIATKLMQTSLAVREVAMKLIHVLLYVGVSFLGVLALLGATDWRLMLPLIGWLAGYLALMWLLLPRMQRASKAQADARSIMTGRIVDSYQNFQTIKLFAHGRRETAYARDAMTGFLGTVHWQMRLVTVLEVSLFVLNGVLFVAVAGLTLWLWAGNLVSLGALAVGITVALRLSGLSHWIIWEVGALFENIGTVYDGIATLSKRQAVVDAPDARPLEVVQGGIRFDRVSFHYGKGKGVIDGLDLAIAPGEKIGLVGPSGAGKSTTVNLLLRLFDVEGGRILIDDQDIATVTQESLRAQIAMVTQDAALLHRSVRDNILYGSPEASEEAMRAAAAKAHADEFIPHLADAKGRTGYDAHVGERGVRLSGGQRQRIALARVFLKNAPILLLDEATSALDSEVEAAIQESLDDLMADKTVIAIAHRLSTIASMDRLVVMQAGRIVEQGSHQDLLAAGGLYARLWQRQSGGFLGQTARAAAE